MGVAERVCKRYYVTGRVQGVFFRASTAAHARERGITGWARNLRDGRVEVLACGDPGAVEALGDWLWEGPPAARVREVAVEDASCDPYPESFATR